MTPKKVYLIFLALGFCFFKVSAQLPIGFPAYEIALPTVQGDTLKLSSLKGKVVLLDFWASWCGPCRVANKNLTRIYDKYKSKGLEILSVSLDEKKENWEKAIQKDNLRWLQVIDPGGGWETPTALQWGVEALPTTYLLDRAGLVIAVDLEGKELEKALKQNLAKK